MSQQPPSGLFTRTGLMLIAGCGALVVAVVMFRLVMPAYAIWQNPGQAFADTFDANLSQSVPIAAEAVRTDPMLRNELLEKTRAAYLARGWDAASAVLEIMLSARLIPYADDAYVLAVTESHLENEIRLQADAAACRHYVMLGGNGDKSSASIKSGKLDNTAMWPAIQNGAANKRAGAVWTAPSDQQVIEVWDRISQGQFPLSERESAAMTISSRSDDGALHVRPEDLCSAHLKVSQNVLALPRREAAWTARIMFYGLRRINWIGRQDSLRRAGVE